MAYRLEILCNFKGHLWNCPKFWTHTPQNMHFTRCKKFDKLWYVGVMTSFSETGPWCVRASSDIKMTTLAFHMHMALIFERFMLMQDAINKSIKHISFVKWTKISESWFSGYLSVLSPNPKSLLVVLFLSVKMTGGHIGILQCLDFEQNSSGPCGVHHLWAISEY